jgi:hypothetical protein
MYKKKKVDLHTFCIYKKVQDGDNKFMFSGTLRGLDVYRRNKEK